MGPIQRTVAFLTVLACAGVPNSAMSAPHLPQPVTFQAPAGDRAAGPLSATDDFGRILPSGRIVRPAGISVVVGMNALGFALTPDGRYAIVSNDDERERKSTSALDPQTTGGYSLAVVDTATMTVVSRYRHANESFFAGIVALVDPADSTRTLVLASGGPSNAVYAFDLAADGTLTPDAQHTIAIPGPSDARFANAGRSFPSTLALSRDGSRAFVVDNLGNDVAQIDTASRKLAGPPVGVGFFPFGVAMTPQGLLVANEGLMAYGVLPAPTIAPPFANVAPDLARASSLTLLPVAPDGSLASASAASAIPLDRTPDGVRAVGGAHPAAIVALKSKPYAFVALSNVDRVATVVLGSFPRAVGGTELRLYDRGPYGTQPTALALSADEKRLYVALSGINAIAVLDTRDPLHPHRIGLIPTGWYPDALALSSDERYLYVANAKGVAESDADWSTFERIDLRATDLRKTTPGALATLRAIVQPKAPNPIVPQRFLSRGSTVIKHVVLILEENKTYDAMLGDLADATGAPYGPGDPGYVSFGASVTPNLRALARTFGLAGNLYADADDSSAAHQFVAAGIASAYTEKSLRGEDPEGYPRAGYIWNSLADRAKTYRDYGDLLRVTGYEAGGAIDDDAPALGLGGTYSLDVPAPAVLSGHVDPNFPGWNVHIRDVQRAKEFIRDFDPLVKADAVPAFTEIWLPGDRGSAGPNAPALSEDVADGDRALGAIVEYLTHTPQWNKMAIVIMPADAQSRRDHVNGRRTYAVVVSPFAKRHYIGMRHLSTVSVLKTEEELLGLPALSLGDELATDMSDFFTRVPDRTPYLHLDVPQP
jgi:DNA-binding beta-propeller fold protein YncE